MSDCTFIVIMQQMETRKDAFTALRESLTATRDRMTTSSSAMRQVLAAPENLAVEDQVSLLHEQHLALSRHCSDRHTLGLIEAALNRLDRDEFGICQECDDEISLKRLFALPWASRCKPCQERYERREGTHANAAAAVALTFRG